jgi:hypothetical protein
MRAAMPHPRLVPFLLAVLLALCAPAGAQKLARKYFEDEEHGYQFKPPEDFEPVPPQPQEAELGTIVKLAGKELSVRKDNETYTLAAGAVVLRFAERSIQGEAGQGGTVSSTKVRDDIGAYLKGNYKGLDKDKPILDEEKKVNHLTAHHRTWAAQTANKDIPLLIDAWSFHLSDADLHLVYVVPEEHGKKWIKVFEQSAKTFMEVGRSAAGAALKEGASYAELLAFHKADAEKIPGWTAIPTPTQKFILKTSSDDKQFLEDVIERLEKSRVLYEADYPTPPGFNHVSIVRVCANEEEFHKYGNTPPGVAGWFNPATTELVLYDAVSIDRNQSFAVMSHEAFHQYCFFLFDQAEAHRWFDEGHGDYYGGAEFKGSKAVITPTMPGGLNRREVIKEMVNTRTYAPISEHINYDHAAWQSQGPTNVSCYAQSWSIVYMLRQGMLGKVPKKAWKPGYAAIIPSYVEALHAGFVRAFDDIRAERQKAAVDEGREAGGDELLVNRFDLPPGVKEKIWKDAMDASWGKVDVDEFERDWVTFVQDCL